MSDKKTKCCKASNDATHEARIKLFNEIKKDLKTITSNVSDIKKDIEEIKQKINDDLIIEIDKKEKSSGWWY